ncbi:hypothetical protein [Paenibacillus sp. FSL H7-0331]|uniref:hypothetical protein n=2 Tax=Paenibacillus sp. FSL H7-0331 TaxID=1920421 RepID=UPI0015C39F32|nr:hypothetical protein [Paenibacillus sp. FSL H7-0331]
MSNLIGVMMRIFILMIMFVSILSGCDADNLPPAANTASVTKPEIVSAPIQSSAQLTAAAPSQPSSQPSIRSTLDKFIARGYQVEEKHIFTRNFEGIGELTVTPVTQFGNLTEFPLSLILTGGNKEIVLTPIRADGHPMFSSFEAISFKDIDDGSPQGGYADITVIANFITGAGQDGAKPFSDIFIFKNDTKGGFVEETSLEDSITSSIQSRTYTMKTVFDLAKSLNNNSHTEDKQATHSQVISNLCDKATLTNADIDQVIQKYNDTYTKQGLDLSESGEDNMYLAMGSCFYEETLRLTATNKALIVQVQTIKTLLSEINNAIIRFNLHYNGGGTMYTHGGNRSEGANQFYIHQFVKMTLNGSKPDVDGYNKRLAEINQGLTKLKAFNKVAGTDDWESNRDKIDVAKRLSGMKSEVETMTSSIEKLTRSLQAQDAAAVYLLDRLVNKIQNILG